MRRRLGPPCGTELKDAPLLDHWHEQKLFGASVLVGRVFGHPVLGSDRWIVTSELLARDPQGRWARTRSRWYRLGRRGGQDIPPA
jgi:hypothetical protein